MPPHIKVTLTENEARAVQLAVFNMTEHDEPCDKYDKAALRASGKISDALCAKNLASWGGARS